MIACSFMTEENILEHMYSLISIVFNEMFCHLLSKLLLVLNTVNALLISTFTVYQERTYCEI